MSLLRRIPLPWKRRPKNSLPVSHGSSVEGEKPRRLNLRRHVRDHPANGLELGNRPPKLDALLGIGHGCVQARLCQTDRLGGDSDPAPSREAMAITKPSPLSQKVLLWNRQSSKISSTVSEARSPIYLLLSPLRIREFPFRPQGADSPVLLLLLV